MLTPVSLLRLLPLLTLLALPARSQYNPYSNPFAYPTWDVPYTATTTITSGSSTATSTLFYTIISSTVTLYVGETAPVSLFANNPSTTLTTNCPSDFYYVVGYVSGIGNSGCLYCPSIGFYTYHGQALCMTRWPYTASCAAGYGIPSSLGVTTGQIITFNPCHPSVIPPIPDCPGDYSTSSGACWTKTLLATIKSNLWTSTTLITQINGGSTFTYSQIGYTYVYASGINPSTIGYGSVGLVPAAGYVDGGELTLGAKTTNPAVLSVLAGEVAWTSGYVAPTSTATPNVASPIKSGDGVGAMAIGLGAVVAGVVVGLFVV